MAKTDVNKRKILIEASDDSGDDPERKKPHLSTGDDEQNEKVGCLDGIYVVIGFVMRVTCSCQCYLSV